MTDSNLRRIVFVVMLLNIAYFFVEFGFALAAGSVSLFADSIDFLEDTSINLLIFVAFYWSVQNRARAGMLLAMFILVPGFAALWTAWQKINTPTPPDAASLSLVGVGALLVNFTCALLLVRYRHHRGSLARGAFLSARNDVLADLAIIGAGVVTAYTNSIWPDLVVGLGIAGVNADAAWEVWQSAREELQAAENM